MAVAEAPTATITRRSGVDLARAIRNRGLSAREVLEAHLGVIERANPRVNAIVADRFEKARDEADAADARVAAAAPGEQLPPLLGVPFTVKESFAVEGMPNCAGQVARRDHCCEEDATVVARLREAGAIPIGVTNTSELTMWIESRNRVYGLTRNAYDPRRTAGGSSGGEGSAIGSGMAPFGLGSDIGGSIRLPAFFNGVFGHKNSSRLVPATGHFPATEGETFDLLGVGPLARHAEDLMPVLRAIAGPDGKEERVLPLELKDPVDVDVASLEVVISEDTSYIRASSELRAARERAANALSARGASVRRVSLRRVRRALDHYLATLSSGSEQDLLDMVFADGPRRGVLRMAAGTARRRSAIHTWPTVLLVLSYKLNSRIPPARTAKSVAAGKALAAEIDEAIGDGVMLHPPFARVAPRHGRTVGRPWLITNPSIFNLSGHPATTVPLGLNPRGLPLGVQVAGAHGADHRTIAVAQALEADFGGWTPPAGA